MKGAGAIVFLAAFFAMLLMTIVNVELPPGVQIYNSLNLPYTDYPVFGVQASTLIIAIINGVIYGIIVWAAFTILVPTKTKKASKATKSKAAAEHTPAGESTETAMDQLSSDVVDEATSTVKDKIESAVLEPSNSGACENCGKQLKPNTKFCPYCGTPATDKSTSAVPESSSLKICKNCGKQLNPHAQFCPSCGKIAK